MSDTLSQKPAHKKIGYVSLGCAKNQVDFEHLIGALSNDGFIAESDVSLCDAVIINTCGFIEPAVKEAVDNILFVSHSMREGAKLIVTGCMAARYKDDIKNEMPEIDFVSGVGESELNKAADFLREFAGVTKGKHDKIERVIVNYPYYAFLKIAEGCNNRCSYCTIPSIRGGLKSRTEADIIAEAEYLINQDVKELIIISQDTTKYGVDTKGKSQTASLLKKLALTFPKTFFRVLYLNPDGVTDELIDVFAEYDNIVKYFEIPVQHVSDKVLKAMNRHSDAKKINDTFDKIRVKIPSAFIRTTFIVGFPTETEADFNEVVRFIEEKKPDFAGFFPYYAEDGTQAATLENIVDKKSLRARIKQLQKLQKQNTRDRLKQYKKEPFLAYAEKTNDDFEFIAEGRAMFQAPEIDGKLYITDGVADNGAGPYLCVVTRIAYPDVFVRIVG